MNKKNIMAILLLFVVSFSLIGCNLKDDYIIKTNEDTDEKPSDDKINEIFESEKMTEFLDKLKTEPKEISDKLDEIDSDEERTMKELNEKADQLIDALNSADFDGKSEEIKDKMDEISDKLDEMKDNINDAKDRVDSYENPIDEKKVTDVIDNFSSHMDNLQEALDRASSTR